jgi:hypothetical protein
MAAYEIKKDKLGGTDGTHGRTEKYIYYLVETHGRKRLLGRPKRRWEKIIFVFKETNLEGVDWVRVVLDSDRGSAVVREVRNFRV